MDEKLKKRRQKLLQLKIDGQLPVSDDAESMLQFQDSLRDSVKDYFFGGSGGKGGVDTPTRLLAASNEFLPHESVELPVKKGKEHELLTPRKEYRLLKDKLELLAD